MLLAHTTNPPGWTLFQLLVWIIQRREVSPEEAEELCYSLNSEIVDWALDVLTTVLFKAVYGAVEGLPIVAAWVGDEDLATIFRRSWVPGAGDVLWHELREFIMKSEVRFNPRWATRITWPTLLSAAQAVSTPTQPTEPAVADETELISSSEVEPEESQPPNTPDPVGALIHSTPATQAAPADPPASPSVAQPNEAAADGSPARDAQPPAPDPIDAQTPTTPATPAGPPRGYMGFMPLAPSQSGPPGDGAEELPHGAQPPESAPIPMVLLLYDQMVVWIVERRMVSPEEAERLVNSPEMAVKIARAERELDRVWRAELGRAKAKYDEYERAVVEEGRTPPELSDDDDVFCILGLEGRTYSTTAWVYRCRTGQLPAEDVGLNDATWDHIAGVLEGIERKWPARAADMLAAQERAESPTTSPAKSETVPPVVPDTTSTPDAPASQTPPAPEQTRPQDRLEGEREDAHQEVLAEDDEHSSAGVTINAPDETENARGVTINVLDETENARGVTINALDETENRRGRPSTGEARTGAERQRAWRTRKLNELRTKLMGLIAARATKLAQPQKEEKAAKATVADMEDQAEAEAEGRDDGDQAEGATDVEDQAVAIAKPTLDDWIAAHRHAIRGGRPKEGWSKFYDKCRNECDGWADKKNGKPAANFTNKTIRRRLEQDK
jgi:hypothetical protein